MSWHMLKPGVLKLPWHPTWHLDPPHAHNGWPDTRISQVSLIGHSAGAHSCMMALMHRAHTAGTPAAAAPCSSEENDPYADPRMPAHFIGAA